MMKHAWDGYANYAWGKNELRPVTKRGHSASIFGSAAMGASIVDGMVRSEWIEISSQKFHFSLEIIFCIISFEKNIERKNSIFWAYAHSNLFYTYKFNFTRFRLDWSTHHKCSLCPYLSKM